MRYQINGLGFMSVSVTPAEVKGMGLPIELKEGLFAYRSLTRNELDLVRINQGTIKCHVRMEKGARPVLEFQVTQRSNSTTESKK